MNKLLGLAAMVALLACACSRKEEPTTGLPPASDTTLPPVADAASASADMAARRASAAEGMAATADGDRLVNAAIDRLLGDHRRYQAVIGAYRNAVAGGDRSAVAALVHYPFEVTIDGDRTSIKDAAAFVQAYDRIITAEIARVITRQKYSELVVSYRGVMFGGGETWINGICKAGSADCSDFEARVIAIQAGGTSTVAPGTPP